MACVTIPTAKWSIRQITITFGAVLFAEVCSSPRLNCGDLAQQRREMAQKGLTGWTTKIEEGLAYFQAHPAEVKRLMGTYLDQMAVLVAAA